MSKVKNLYWHLKRLFYYKFILRCIGARALIIKPIKIDHPKSIEIGNNTYIGHYAWLMGSGGKSTSLIIKDGVQIGHFAHLISMGKVVIESNVLIADKVFISDCTHNYDGVEKPIMEQGIRTLSPVTIGEGSWLGENVCVCGASIGRHCVIGANSVVTYDIPNYCVAVGSPAKVVKKYDFDIKEWVNVT